MRAQLLLQHAGPSRPPGCGRHSDIGIDLDHPVKRPQVDRHHAREASAIDRGLDAADDAGPAAERDHRGVGLQRPPQHRLHLGLVAGRATTSGGCSNCPRKARTTSRYELP